MPKRKSSRAAVRNTPQPKAHSYIPAVFVDDYGRERVLTIASAKAFSKKKLDAACRAVERKSDRDMDRAIEAGDRETARAIRRLRKQERETDRSIARFFRRRIRTKMRPTSQIKHKPPKAKPSIWPGSSRALPKYDGPIRDKFNRRGVFFRSRYYSSRTAKPGVSKRVAIYIYSGSALDEHGNPMFRTNAGLTIDEAVCGLDHHEQVNRSAQKNAKVLNHAVLAMDHRWTPAQMLEVGERWAEERFGRYGLPYAISLHEPPPDGDERNWHLHVIWSWRPLERVGDHEWLVGESLRTELDGAQGMRMLRERLAAMMTEMSFEAGDADVYTALSYAARSLPVIAQIHLDEGRTRQAREGKVVEANEENHDRVVRSITALADDELRAEDERLALLQAIAKRIAERFTKKIAVPPIPAIAMVSAKVTASISAIELGRLRLAKSISGATGSIALPRQKFMTSDLSSISQRIIAEAGRSKFANLRILTTSHVAVPTSRRFAIARVASPSAPVTDLNPVHTARAVSVVPVPLKFNSASFTVPRPISISHFARSAPGNVRQIGASIKTATLTGNAMAGSGLPPATSSGVSIASPPIRFVATTFSVPKPPSVAPIARPVPNIPRLPGMPDRNVFVSGLCLTRVVPAPGPPAAINMLKIEPPPVHKPFASPRITSVVPIPRAPYTLVSKATFESIRAMISRASDAATVEDQKPADTRDAAETRQCTDAKALEALFEILAEKKRLIVERKDGRLTVASELRSLAGLSADQIAEPQVQERLSEEMDRQRDELDAIATFAVPNPSGRLISTSSGWRLSADAPEQIRFAAFNWREDTAVQNAFLQVAKLPAIAEDDEEAIAVRRLWFLWFIYRQKAGAGSKVQRSNEVKSHSSKFPYPEGTGIGD